jgi:hypothetical protein
MQMSLPRVGAKRDSYVERIHHRSEATDAARQSLGVLALIVDLASDGVPGFGGSRTFLQRVAVAARAAAGEDDGRGLSFDPRRV